MFSLLVVATIAQQAHTQLLAAARASGRPPECAPLDSQADGRRGNVWTRARSPRRVRYCNLIARAHARLRGDPTGAAKAAEEARKILPNYAAPYVVLARAALRNDKVADAEKLFAKAIALSPRSVDQPLAMLDLARTQKRANKLTDALASYRRLAPRAALLPTRTARAGALLEAAHVAMSQAGGSKQARASERYLDEALAFLREAARDPHHGLHDDVLLSLTLVLDRAGLASQADALLLEQRGTRAWLRHHTKTAPHYLVADADHAALSALAWQARSLNDKGVGGKAQMLARWKDYLANKTIPTRFAAAASQRRKRLGAPTQPSRRRRR